MVAMAQRKQGTERDAPPMTTASDIPKTTGMVEAGRAQGRAAINHLASREGLDPV
jgi:hypothetical protein